jgi:hypothetical protein
MPFKHRVNWKEELPVIKQLGSMGTSQTALAKRYGVTRQRMKQVIDKHIPDWHENYGHAVNRKIEAEEHFSKWGQKSCTDLYKIQRHKFRAKKANAVAIGYEWTVEFGELEWPEKCPILGMEIDYFAETRQENSPSFDQIDPGKGYVSGNVQILSWRANRIKNNGTAEEHRLIADYLDKLNSVSIAKKD